MSHKMIDVPFSLLYNENTLLKAHIKSRVCKRKKKPIVKFESELGYEIYRLSSQLINKTYRIAGYHRFHVFEPKKREIQSLQYPDRVVQHALCDEVLADFFSAHAIYDNCACRKGRGQHFALKRLKGFLRSYYRKYGSTGYFLKCDILKYFPSIPHRPIKKLFLSRITDPDIRELFEMIIDSHITPDSFLNKYNIPIYHKVDNGFGKVKNLKIERGVPIGNQTSQIIGMYFLNGIDRLCKEKLHIKYYSRYMDDFILIHHDKAYLQYCLKEITRYLETELLLKLNDKTQISTIKNGIPYLGWKVRLLNNGQIIMRVRRRTVTKFKRQVKLLYTHKGTISVDKDRINQTVNSYRGYLHNGNCHRLFYTTIKKYDFSNMQSPVDQWKTIQDELEVEDEYEYNIKTIRKKHEDYILNLRSEYQEYLKHLKSNSIYLLKQSNNT